MDDLGDNDRAVYFNLRRLEKMLELMTKTNRASSMTNTPYRCSSRENQQKYKK